MKINRPAFDVLSQLVAESGVSVMSSDDLFAQLDTKPSIVVKTEPNFSFGVKTEKESERPASPFPLSSFCS